MAVFWAIACMVFSAANDLLFKFYARIPRSNGRFVAMIGVIWFFFALSCVREMPAQWGATIFWGVISGFCSAGGNLLMLRAMRVLDAGVCSTIYRLNLVPVVIGAALLLEEEISLTGWIGILCALAAVIGFLPRKSGEKNVRDIALISFGIIITASLMRAAMGLSYSYGFAHGAERSWVVVINSLFWVIGGILCALSEPAPANKTESRKLWAYGIGSGILVTVIVLTMAAGLAAGKASIVLPIAQMSFLLTGLAGAIFLKEPMTLRKIAAMLSGAAAVVLLSL
ncbi:MAG: EamA family transporter [Lentisphaeria bacterium]|nr:EamA family transporter [Lentisphaeria bacterium]